MGVCIRCSNNLSADLMIGYGGFSVFRHYIGNEVSPSYEEWSHTMPEDMKDNFMYKAMGYIPTPKKRIDELYFNVLKETNKGTHKFLTSSDCEGKLSVKECKDLLESIKNLGTNRKFGYQRDDAWTLDDFKELLTYCIEHKRSLVWS